MRLALGLCIAATAWGQALSLQDCIQKALHAPSSVSLARQDEEIARQGVTAARASFLPQFGVGGGFTYNSPGPGGQQFVALNGTREYSVLPGTTFELDTSGRLRALYARAKADLQIAGVRAQIAERDLRRIVASAFYRVLLARRLVQVNEDMLGEASAFEKRSQDLLEGGEVAKADVVRATGQVAFFRQGLQSAQLEAQLANQDLASFWTDQVDVPLPLQDELDSAPQSVADDQANIFLRRPEFSLFSFEKFGFEAERRLARSELLPRVGFQYQYGIDSNRLSFADRGSAAVLSLSVPVFDWYRARSLGRQARIRGEQVDTNRAISTRTFSRDLSAAQARLKSLSGQIDATKLQVSTSEQNLQLSRLRYEGGEGPSLDVVVAQQQLAQARTNYALALAAYANAKADLEVAAGR